MQQLPIPPLSEGETYIGAIGNPAGDIYHLVLLSGDNGRAPHQAQIEWAKSIGGDLPNKLESSMLFAHAPDQFEKAWYWTNETFIDPEEPEDTKYAWVLSFTSGNQGYDLKDTVYRARAVRRLPI